MAADKGSNEQDHRDDLARSQLNGSNQKGPAKPPDERDGDDDQDEDDEEDEEEPRLKYAPITRNLSSLYRNGDASSAFLVAGDKMIVGTHNGNIHVFSLPTFQSLRYYHAHSASVSAVSISPFPPPLPFARHEGVGRVAQQSPSGHDRVSSPPSETHTANLNKKQQTIPPTPNNQIYIATSSIDGNVCIQNLLEVRDVQLRNFGRPVQAVALSPEYKSDRTYLSGGLAGSLVLTVGGQTGRPTNATTTGAAAAASGWLGSMGLGSNTGTDRVLHSGEGSIHTIKWSLSGRYVLWVNEHGIKIMRSHLHLDSADSGSEWKRMSHIDRPNRPGWEDMAGVWRARAEWIDRDNLERDENSSLDVAKSRTGNGRAEEMLKDVSRRNKPEEVVIGWGGTVWLLKVLPGSTSPDKSSGERSIGRVEITTILRTDCIISGISLYTPNLLLVLAYIEAEQGQPSLNDTPNKTGRHHRHNALEPELRLIDISKKPEEEVSADTLTISRFEALSASDYHLGILPPTRISSAAIQRGALESIGSGLWDATLYPTRMFSSSVSIRSGRSTEEKASTHKASSTQVSAPSIASTAIAKDVQNVASTQGSKIFILSPYDCVVAVKRDLSDRVAWLTKTGRYEEAWELLHQHPEAAGALSDDSGTTSPDTPSKAGSVSSGQPRAMTSLADFFADDMSNTSQQHVRNINSVAEKEKRRIGELWLQQLVSAKDWATAGEVAGKVLGTSSRWEHWSWTFIRNNKFDEIAHSIPTFQITPPLPSPIYEIFLGHYVLKDRPRFKELLDLWPTDLFEITTVMTAIEEQLKSDTTKKDSEDWRILKECQAKLFVADGRHEDALRCYIQLQDADTALSMIREYHLLGEISDDIPGLVMLRVSEGQLKSGSIEELETASSEPIKLLVSEAYSGTVTPKTVISQLQDSKRRVFVYFYLRALWRGEGASVPNASSRTGRGRAAVQSSLAADEGKVLVDEFADTAVEVFADYDRDLLMEYLHASTAYTFDNAVRICERKRYTSELVYLLSKTGQTKKALFLIIDDLKDVSQAIAFAKEQDDQDLWDDLLEYSMSRPKFIEGLLSEVGTAIDPITLIKRIPSGLEIEGLRNGLQKMIREYDLQDSISAGAARVLQSEVAIGMEKLRKGRNRGLRFDVEERPISNRSTETLKPSITATSEDAITTNGVEYPTGRNRQLDNDMPKPGHCAGCAKAFSEDESESLVIFACSHSWHVSHLLDDGDSDAPTPTTETPSSRYLRTGPSSSRTVGQKVTNARLLKDKIAAVGGCRICSKKKKERDMGG